MDMGWRWGGGTHSTGTKRSYNMKLLTLSAKHKQCLSRSALPGCRMSYQKSLVTVEKSGATLKPVGVVDLGKLLLHFILFFWDFKSLFMVKTPNLECIFGFT